MKKLVAAIAAIALIGTPAFAQAPPPAPAPVYNWTGWYVGGNVGASFGTFKTDFNAVPGTLTILSGGGSATSTIPGFAGRDEVYPAGFIGGGQIGYNWQYSPLIVLGVEADFQGANERDGASFSNNVSFIAQAQQIGGGTAPVPFSATAVTNYATKIEWFGTVRGRIGYVWGNGDVMSYLTGGLAYGKVDIEGTSVFSASSTGLPPLSSSQTFGHSNVNTGWVVGSGTEGKLLNFPGWTLKAEVLYMDLGHLDATGPGGSAQVFVPPAGPTDTANVGPVATHTHFTDTILRVGVNYQFH